MSHRALPTTMGPDLAAALNFDEVKLEDDLNVKSETVSAKYGSRRRRRVGEQG
ncbi:hypothetical protein VYU27_009251, partial [Nannochloropsis oceanica]